MATNMYKITQMAANTKKPLHFSFPAQAMAVSNCTSLLSLSSLLLPMTITCPWRAKLETFNQFMTFNNVFFSFLKLELNSSISKQVIKKKSIAKLIYNIF